jgi:predicted O-methyltransferase YrrM
MGLKAAVQYRRLLLRTRPRRYVELFRTIYERRRCSLVEIGTWNGVHAEQMILTAAAHADVARVRYRGFDLFEDLTDEQLKREFSKRPPAYETVLERLRATGADVALIRGNTRITLPQSGVVLSAADLVFIDGGHSIETITADWDAVRAAMRPDTIVIFDDYYPDPEPALSGLGCQSIVDRLDRSTYEVEVLPTMDAFPQPWGVLRVRMARVSLRTS